MPQHVGDQFAGYTIIRQLGAGGMGEVYLVSHPRLPRQDALKVLPAHLTADASFQHRFLREADLASTLQHPHIVGVHDRGEHDGQLWMSMDYIDGSDAGKLLTAQPHGLPPATVADIVAAVADALDFAHERGMLHRDVKPANILVATPTSTRSRIFLADFGIARHTEDTHGLTETNTTVGTVNYAAPEQLLGQPLTAAADQYALAATAYQLLTGSPPFANSNPAVVIGQHLNAPPPRLSATRPELAGFDECLTRALAKDPAARFPNCTAFATAFRNAAVSPAPMPDAQTVSHLPPPMWPAYPPPPAPFEQSRPQRNRALAIVIPVILVLLLALAGGAAWLGTKKSAGTTAGPPRWQPYLDAAKQSAVNLTTINYTTVDADIRRILDHSTGPFKDDFAKSADNFAKVVRDAKSISKGSVTAAGLESLEQDKAVVLAAVTATTTNNDAAAQPPKNWRLRLTVVRDGDAYKTSNVEFVS